MQNKINSIISSLKWKINSGVWGVSERLPSENALAIKYNCSRITARRALQHLKDEKLLVTRPGKGYFISAGTNKLKLETKQGTELVQTQFHYGKFEFDPRESLVFEQLNYPVKEYIDNSFDFYKTQFDKEGNPFTVLHSIVNMNVVGQINVEDIKESFSAFLGKKSINVHKRIERITIVEPPQVIKIKLNLHKNQLVVASHSIMLNEIGAVIEYAVRYTMPEEYVETFERKY